MLRFLLHFSVSFPKFSVFFDFFDPIWGMELIKLAATAWAYISAIKRTNCEAVKRHSNEFRSQTLVHRTDWTHTITYTDINHLAQLNMKNPFRSVVIYAVSGFRQPQLKRRRCRHHILVGIFLFRFSFPFSFSFFFASPCDLLKGSQQLINFVLCMGISPSPFPHIFFSRFHCYFLCVSRAIFARLSCQAISAADI